MKSLTSNPASHRFRCRSQILPSFKAWGTMKTPSGMAHAGDATQTANMPAGISPAV